MNKKYTSEHIEFFRENTPERTYKELTELFNKRFGTDLPVSTVMSASFRYGFKNGRDTKLNKGYQPTQFKKGHIPFNKGKKMNEDVYEKCKGTMFKKENVPHNHRPVGSERINVDGYTEIKVSEPNKWKSKHVVVWEAANSTVPKGYVLIFADGNRLNIALDNLLLISQRELVTMNKYGLISSNAELTKSGVVTADIRLKIGEQKRKLSNRPQKRMEGQG